MLNTSNEIRCSVDFRFTLDNEETVDIYGISKKIIKKRALMKKFPLISKLLTVPHYILIISFNYVKRLLRKLPLIFFLLKKIKFKFIVQK